MNYINEADEYLKGGAEKGLERTCGNCIYYSPEFYQCRNMARDDENGFYKKSDLGCWYHRTQADQDAVKAEVQKRIKAVRNRNNGRGKRQG